MIDPRRYVVALSAENPSGPNLEYDPDFSALERARVGRPEQMIGDTVKAGEDPNWRDVCERAENLLARTRDLRVVVTLTTAQFQIYGFPGLAGGLEILKGLLAEQWATVHPQLDEDDHDDPTFRMNALLPLAAPDGMLKPIREAAMFHSKRLGSVSLRTFRIATGRLPAPTGSDETPKAAQIEAALRDADAAAVKNTAADIMAALEHLNTIDGILVEKAGAHAPNLKPLAIDLSEIKQLLTGKAGAGVGVVAANGGDKPAPSAPVLSASGEVKSREDVVREIDRLCDYYQRHEPSSPVPLLLGRAKRLVSKNFLDIIRDLTPSGVAEAESLGGIERAGE